MLVSMLVLLKSRFMGSVQFVDGVLSSHLESVRGLYFRLPSPPSFFGLTTE